MHGNGGNTCSDYGLMQDLLNTASGGNLILPLVCVLILAVVTLMTGVIASRKGSRPWVRSFFLFMTLFLAASALLTGTLTRWYFGLVFLLPGGLLALLFRRC